MNRKVFENNLGKYVRITLKPHFILEGTIDYVFDDCFEFTTTQKSSYLDFDQILTLVVLE